MKSVSVVMCTYNGAQYIREQLDSIINQTYPIFEIIIQMIVLRMIQWKLFGNISRVIRLLSCL